MLVRNLLLTATALIAGATTAAAIAAPDAAFFAGRWRIVGVAVSDTGVQALADNDPSLMGRLLEFSPARLAWARPPATGDVCVDPTFIRLSTPAPAELRPQLRKLGLPRPAVFSIRCQTGQWGPNTNSTIFRGAGGQLALPWYDGSLLKLVRR